MKTFSKFFSGSCGVMTAVAFALVLLTACCMFGVVALPVVFPVTPMP